MDRTENVEQLIWEFVYELLPEDEAAEIERRITSEPDVARVYAEVVMQSELLAKATKVERPPLPFKELMQEAEATEARRSRMVSLSAGPLSTAARAANWLVGLAASVLVCIMGYSYVRTDSPVREVAVSEHQQSLVSRHVRTTLFGPKRVQPDPATYFTVLTRSAVGEPRSVDLAYRFYDAEDNLLASSEARTNTGGLAQIETPQQVASSKVRLEVETKKGLAVQPIESEFPVADVELSTHLTTDKPLYRPGETIRYRSVTLSRYGLRVRRKVNVEFQISDSKGAVVSASESSDDTEHSVGQGRFEIPANQPGGKYTLVARSPSDEFAEARRDFYIRQYRTPTLKKRLEFARDSFTQGDVSIEFSPESGDLVAGVVNRVYFHARDSVGKPAHVEGRILDNRGRQVAEAKTIHDGRGKFSFTPSSDEVYHLKLDTPAGADDERRLPTTSDEQFVTMNTGPGVFDAGQPVQLQIRSTQCSKPLAVTAVCRGAVAGQQVVSGDQFVSRELGIGSCDIDVPLAQHADGVIRLTAYDLNARPPLPVAERLVYRRPQKKLDIQMPDLDESYSPGDQVDLSLVVKDENGVSRQTVLGVSVVDDALVSLADDKSTRMTTHFWLTSQIDKPEDLEDANFYLKEDPESAAALDLLLGTQGWRRFSRMPLDRLAGASTSGLAGAERSSKLADAPVIAEPAAPRMLADNGQEAHAVLERTVRDYHLAREVDLRRTGQVVFAGGAAVLIALAIMGLLRLIGSFKVWVPAGCAATVCLITGWQWMGALVDPQDLVASLPDAPEDEEVRIAQVETEEDSVSRMLWRKEEAEQERAAPAQEGKMFDRLDAVAMDVEMVEQQAEKGQAAVREAAPAPAGPPASVARRAPAPAAPRPAPAAVPSRPEPAAEEPASAPVAGEAAMGDRNAKPYGAGVGGGEFGAGAGFGVSPDDNLEGLKKKAESKSLNGRRGEPAPSEPGEPKKRGRGADMPVELYAAPALEEKRPVPDEEIPDLQMELDEVESPAPAPARHRASTAVPADGARGVLSPMLPKQVKDDFVAGRKAPLPEGRDDNRGADFDTRLLFRQYRYLSGKPTAWGRQVDHAENLYWQPLLLTDPAGQTSIQFTLPNVTTTFRVLVNGHADGRIGSADGQVVSKTPSP